MAKNKLVKCSDCGHEISKKAKTCPNCGAKPKKGSLVAILVLIGFIWFMISLVPDTPRQNTRYTTSQSTVADTKPTPAPNQLKVLSWNCGNDGHGYMHLRGEVKNISSSKIDNVMAVVVLRTADGDLVKSDTALLEYNPIMPGQTSPFHVISTHNPAIDKCSLSFKTVRGRSISFED